MSLEGTLSFAKFGRILTNRPTRPTVLVVSPAEFIENLKEALLIENKQQCAEMMQFIFCEHVEDILEWTSHNHLYRFDYIVIVLNPRESTCVTTTEDNISKIDSTYVEAGRICFVNGACSVIPAEMGIPLGHINALSQKYSVMLINGDILNPEKCPNLASAIVELVQIVIGFRTGVPTCVDIPGYFLTD